jgi:hypothetical protein
MPKLSTPQSLLPAVNHDHRAAKGKRYYCPSCGMVAGDDRQIAQVRHSGLGSTVRPHSLTSFLIQFEYLDATQCPGGPIDLEKDRAP